MTFESNQSLVEMPRVPNILIAIDFDGTIVEHKFPEIGNPVPGAREWMLKFQEAEAKLILWTMRDRNFLKMAEGYCREIGITLYSVNFNPTQSRWSHSPKCYAHIYIDDASIGCPLVHPNPIHSAECDIWTFTRKEKLKCNCNPIVDRAYANWEKIGPMVMDRIEKFKENREVIYKRG